MLQAVIIGFAAKYPYGAEAMRRMALNVARQITDKGCWGVWGSPDQMRSSRVATLLQWHERTFKSDPAVSAALTHFVDFITSDRALFSPATGSCAVAKNGGFCLMNNTITTGMVGLVVADLLQFNSTFAWGLPPKERPIPLKSDGKESPAWIPPVADSPETSAKTDDASMDVPGDPLATNCSFPVPASGFGYRGLSRGGAQKSAAACADECCRVGPKVCWVS